MIHRNHSPSVALTCPILIWNIDSLWKIKITRLSLLSERYKKFELCKIYKNTNFSESSTVRKKRVQRHNLCCFSNKRKVTFECFRCLFLCIMFSKIHDQEHCTKIKFSINVFISMCDQTHSFLRIGSHILKESIMENLSFYEVES